MGRTIWTYSSYEEAEEAGFPDDGTPVQISYLCCVGRFIPFHVRCTYVETHAILALVSVDFDVYAQVQDVRAASISVIWKKVHIRKGKTADRNLLVFLLLHLISHLHLLKYKLRKMGYR